MTEAKKPGPGRGRKHGVAGKHVKYIMRFLKPDGTWGYVYPKGFQHSNGSLTHTPEEIAAKQLFGWCGLTEDGSPVTQDGKLYKYEVRWDSSKKKYIFTKYKKFEGILKMEWSAGFEPGSRQIDVTEDTTDRAPERKIKPSRKDPQRMVTKADKDKEAKVPVQLEEANPYGKDDFSGMAWLQVRRKQPKTMSDLRAVVYNYVHDRIDGDEQQKEHTTQALLDLFVDNASVRSVKGSVSFEGNSAHMQAINKHVITDPVVLQRIEDNRYKGRLPQVDPSTLDPKRATPDKAVSSTIHRDDQELTGTSALYETSGDPLKLKDLLESRAKIMLKQQKGGDPKVAKTGGGTTVQEIPEWLLDKYSQYHDSNGDKFESTSAFFMYLNKHPITTMLTAGVMPKLTKKALAMLYKEWAGTMRGMARKVAAGSVYSESRLKAEASDRQRRALDPKNKASDVRDFDAELMDKLVSAAEDTLGEMAPTYHASEDPRDRFDVEMKRHIKNAMLDKFKAHMADKGLLVPLKDEIAGNEDEGVVKEAMEMSPEDTTELYQIQDEAATLLSVAFGYLEPQEEAAFLERLWLDDMGAQEESALIQRRKDSHGEQAGIELQNKLYSTDDWMRKYTGQSGVPLGRRIAKQIKKKRPNIDQHQLDKEVRERVSEYYDSAVSKLRSHFKGTAEGEKVARWLGLRAKLAAQVKREFTSRPTYEVIPAEPARYYHGNLADASREDEGVLTPRVTVTKALVHEYFVKSIDSEVLLPSPMPTPDFVEACDILSSVIFDLEGGGTWNL